MRQVLGHKLLKIYHLTKKLVAMGPQITAVNGQSAELEAVMDIFREMFSGHYHRAGDEGRHVYITARVSKYLTGQNWFIDWLITIGI